MTRPATFLAAALAAIGRPGWWLMALATFLLRGGIVVVVLPILTLPSALAVSNLVAPVVMPLALGRIEPVAVIAVFVLVGLFLAWLIVGGRIAAAIEVALVRDGAAAALDEGVERAATDVDVGPDPSDRNAASLAWRVLAVRLIAWLPLALAIGFGIARIVQVTYVELTRPVDVTIPIAVRVAGEVVGQLGLIVIAWVVGEVVGGVATRRTVLTRAEHGESLAWATRTSASSPLSWLVPWVGTTLLLFVVMGTTLAAAAFAWARAVEGLSDRLANPFAALLTLLLFVALWLAAMVFGGVILAVRATVQTFEHVRRSSEPRAVAAGVAARSNADRGGTFGGGAGSRPGDWSQHDDGGSL